MLAIQEVEILWTKATRGAPRSNERAQLPRAFPFAAESNVFVIQRLSLAEWRKAFAVETREIWTKPDIPTTVGALRIQSISEHAFKIGFLGTPAGQPRRKAVLALCTVPAGCWARITLNARHASYSGQHYSETTYNIACGEIIAVDRFLQASPDIDVDLRADLF